MNVPAICAINQTKCSKEGGKSLNANIIWLLGQHNEIQEHECVYIRIYVLYLLFLTPEAKHSSWEKHQTEEEAAPGRGKRERKAVSYREAYASQLGETLNEVLAVTFLMSNGFPNVVKSIASRGPTPLSCIEAYNFS
ncbi:hypothetical protein RHSIM_RhsimUnG0143700 [Rhododendron simsii]|uniref:Uncharacterized protein n=1 Tax=Rhododendron simsii TaxID=118357 RepID=A0A834L2H3_RHOSS|nr:hypothetical protein RHSIM_RhsimUnG0143700 [Rhododendron simsii]